MSTKRWLTETEFMLRERQAPQYAPDVNLSYLQSILLPTTDKRWSGPICDRWVRATFFRRVHIQNGKLKIVTPEVYCIALSGDDDFVIFKEFVDYQVAVDELGNLKSFANDGIDFTVEFANKRGYDHF